MHYVQLVELVIGKHTKRQHGGLDKSRIRSRGHIARMGCGAGKFQLNPSLGELQQQATVPKAKGESMPQSQDILLSIIPSRLRNCNCQKTGMSLLGQLCSKHIASGLVTGQNAQDTHEREFGKEFGKETARVHTKTRSKKSSLENSTSDELRAHQQGISYESLSIGREL